MDENLETKAVNSIYRENVIYQNEENTFNIAWVRSPSTAINGFSVKSWMTPLIQAPSVIPQLILSLCAVSIATPFNGDNKIKTRILGRVNGKIFY